MAISVLGVGAKVASSNDTSDTLSFTCPSGTSVLIVWITLRGATTLPSGVGVTYNGVTMTSIGVASYGTSRSLAQAFFLQSPDTASAYNVAASWTESASYTISASAWSGTDTSTAPFGWQSSNGNAATDTLTVSSTEAGDVGVDCINQNTVVDLTEGSGQTVLNTEAATSTGSSDHDRLTSYEMASGASVAMSFSSNTARNYCYGAFALKVASENSGSWFLVL